MIEIENLTKSYKLGTTEFNALDNVSFNVRKGEIFGVIGLSGAGKSTLIRCINRLEMPDSGKVLIDGKDILSMNQSELNTERRKISMIFQGFNLFMQKTVFENIAYPLELSGMRKKEINQRVDELLEFVGLTAKKNEYPGRLSGGQKQRVAIARALASKPEILLSDEATSALDPKSSSVILDLLEKAVEEFNLTVIMITHQMEAARRICDRIAVMESGKIVEEGSVEDLFENPKEQITKTLIKTVTDRITEDDTVLTDYGNIKPIKLHFTGDTPDKSIVSEVIKKSGADINILGGNITRLKDTTVGFLIVEINGSDEEKEEARRIFTENKVRMEVIV